MTAFPAQKDLLSATGLAVLLVYGAEIMPPREGRPGIEVTVDKYGTVLLEAVGYPTDPEAHTAIAEAAQACVAAGLLVSFPSTSVARTLRGPARVVRRKS